MVRKFFKIKKLTYFSKKIFNLAVLFTVGYSTYTNWNIVSMGAFNGNTRIGSRDFKDWSTMKVPFFMRSLIFGMYSYWFNVVSKDMVHPYHQYETINKFFTRTVKPRNIPVEENILVCPADSKVLKIQEITEDSVLMIKNVKYSLGQFIYGEEKALSKEEIQKLKSKPENKLYSIIFYLAPGDYHRYHSHDNISVSKINHVPGHLAVVRIKDLHNKTYTENERIILSGETKFGNYFYGIVGATNVGSMDLTFDSSVRTNILEHDYQVSIQYTL